MTRRRIITAAAALGLAVTVIGTELTLPSVAEDKMRDKLGSLGTVTELEVSTFPAFMMLFGDVEHASVEMSSATLDREDLDPDRFSGAGEVEELEARIDQLDAGPFDATAVAVDKRGKTVDVSATLDVAQVEELIPGVRLTTRNGALLLDLSGMDMPLPLPGPLQLEIAPEDGKVVARPLGAASGILPTQALLDRPELSVTRLRSRIAGGEMDLDLRATLNEL